MDLTKTNKVVLKNKPKNEYTEKEIYEIALTLVGHSFADFLKEGNIKKGNKGLNGIIIEQFGYNYEPNSDSEPDFVGAGVELKVTPWSHKKDNSMVAKERLVLNLINYNEEADKSFYTSSFWHKNKKLQIVWYCDDRKGTDIDKINCIITDVLLFKYPDEDLKIILDDWNKIHKKILDGKAHEISEGDTLYLGACTKGHAGDNLKTQPYSDILAKQRAYCLKQPYMTQLVNQYVGKQIAPERLFTIIEKGESFEEKVVKTVGKYVGFTVDELKSMFCIDSSAKNLNEVIISRIFGIKGKLSNTDEFMKAGITVKTIRIEKNGRIKESMSFPAFKFIDIINTDFEDSSFYQNLNETKYLFIIFEDSGYGYVLNNAFFWNMPLIILDTEIRKVYDNTRNIILSGNIVKEIKYGKIYNNFPGMKDNDYCHVRPHGINKMDKYPLPVRDVKTGMTSFTKQCFWLNSKYILKIIDDNKNVE